MLDDAAFGRRRGIRRILSSTDPAAHWTGAHGGRVFFAYPTNYLIDAQHAFIVEVEATNAIRQAEVLIAKRTIECRRSYFPRRRRQIARRHCCVISLKFHELANHCDRQTLVD